MKFFSNKIDLTVDVSKKRNEISSNKNGRFHNLQLAISIRI